MACRYGLHSDEQLIWGIGTVYSMACRHAVHSDEQSKNQDMGAWEDEVDWELEHLGAFYLSLHRVIILLKLERRLRNQYPCAW